MDLVIDAIVSGVLFISRAEEALAAGGPLGKSETAPDWSHQHQYQYRYPLNRGIRGHAHGVNLILEGGIEDRIFSYASRCSTVCTAKDISISPALPAVSGSKPAGALAGTGSDGVWPDIICVLWLMCWPSGIGANAVKRWMRVVYAVIYGVAEKLRFDVQVSVEPRGMT